MEKYKKALFLSLSLTIGLLVANYIKSQMDKNNKK